MERSKVLELVNLPLRGYAKVWSRIWVARNLEVCILEINGEHDVLLSDGAHDRRNHPHLESGEGDSLLNSKEQ